VAAAPRALPRHTPDERTHQELLDKDVRIHVALNLTLREDVLIAKVRLVHHAAQSTPQVTPVLCALHHQCTGRRVCGECGKSYNLADINVPADPLRGLPSIVMPPLSPPDKCLSKMQARSDDTEPVVRARLEVYHQQCGPVEEYYARTGRLQEFPIGGGIPETLPLLLAKVIELVRRGAGATAQVRSTAG
jgi:adenylate kinase family enzyme